MESGIAPAAGGVGLRLRKGQLLRVIDSEGGQTGDLVAYSSDGSERLSNGRSFDYGGKIFFSTGDTLWSDKSNPMLTIVADDGPRHDFLYAACSIEMYRREYGVTKYHPNCVDNLTSALATVGITEHPLASNFNLFMNVEVDQHGLLAIRAPEPTAGRAIIFRADMNLSVAISACPAMICNSGQEPRLLSFQVLDPSEGPYFAGQPFPTPSARPTGIEEEH